jgi:hypothetical protein
VVLVAARIASLALPSPKTCAVTPSAEFKNTHDMTEFKYRCPDCGWDVNTLVEDVSSDERDSRHPVICPSCERSHSVNPANGEVLAADELGDPW